jgi:cytochrome c oxidase assembly protein subunit 15
LLFVGTLVSGSGPHSGGKGTKRIPIAFSTIAQLHSDVALLLIGMTLATLFALHYAKAPSSLQRRARLIFELLVLQGTLGFTQYFLHDNALVVEFHIAGATLIWCGFVTLYLQVHRSEKDESLAAFTGTQ